METWLRTFLAPASGSGATGVGKQYWQTTGEKEHELEKAAFEAGEAIRNLAKPQRILKQSCAQSERTVQYLIGNSNEKIRRVLATAAAPDATTETAVTALLELQGVDLPVASAILAAIYPERYTVLDTSPGSAGTCPSRRALLREYLAFCKRLAESNIVSPARANCGAHAIARHRSCAIGVDAQSGMIGEPG